MYYKHYMFNQHIIPYNMNIIFLPNSMLTNTLPQPYIKHYRHKPLFSIWLSPTTCGPLIYHPPWNQQPAHLDGSSRSGPIKLGGD